MATVPAPTPLRMPNAEPAVGSSTTDAFFSPLRELQFPRALSAPPTDVALPLTLMPRPPASPGPSLPVCVSDPKAVRGGGTVGGAAAAFSSASSSSGSSGSSGSDNSSSGDNSSSSGRAAPLDLPAAGRAHHKAGPNLSFVRAPPRSAPRSTRPRRARQLAGRRRAPPVPAFNRCSRCPRALGVRAAGRAGVPVPSSRPEIMQKVSQGS